jgi:NTP pyrophosphatase (non-canonical NTP hydrolase)
VGLTKTEFMDIAQQMAESVWDFHDRFAVESLAGLPLPPLRGIEHVFGQLSEGRLQMQMEEVNELQEAVDLDEKDNAFEEAADVLYVALGTILVYDKFGYYGCQKVIVKNNNKTLGSHAIDENGKIVRKVVAQ